MNRRNLFLFSALFLFGQTLWAIEATHLVVTNTLIGNAGSPVKIVIQAQDDLGQLASQYATGITFGKINSPLGRFYPTYSDATNGTNEITSEINLINGELTLYFVDTEANDPDPLITATDTDGVSPLLRPTTNNIILNASFPHHMTIVNLPLSGTAGAPVLIKVQARDVFNNWKTMESNAIGFTTSHLSTADFYSNLSDATNMVNPVTMKNFTSGTLHVYYVDTDSDPDPLISLSCTGYTSITNQMISLSHWAAASISITNSFLTGTAGIGIPVRFRAWDTYSNVITGSTRVKFLSSNPSGYFYPDPACLTGTEITNIIFSSSIMTVYYKDTEADDPDPVISILDDDGWPVASGVTNFPVTINPGPVSNINFAVTLTNVPASTNCRFLSADVTDDFGNKVADGTLIYWSFIDQSPANQGIASAFAGSSETSNYTINGVITNSFSLSTKKGDDYIIKAGNFKDPNETVYDTVRLIVVPGPPDQLLVTPLNTTTLPKTNIILNVAVKDSASNIISSRAIHFSNDNPFGNISPKSNFTDFNGQTSSILIMSNYDQQTYHVTVKVDGLSQVCIYTALAGPPATLNLTPNSALVPTGGNQNLTAIIRDANNRAVKDVLVYFNTDFGSVTPLSNYTGANGRAITTLSAVTNEDNKTHTITATILAPSTNDISYIITDSGLPAYLELRPMATNIDPGKKITLTLTALNSQGYPVGNAIINFNSDNGNLNKNNDTTDNFGYTSVELTALAQDNIIHRVIASNMNTSSVTSYITSQAGVPVNKNIILSKSKVLPHGSVLCDVTITDASNAPVANVNVQFFIDKGGILNPTNRNTDSYGKAWTVIRTALLDNIVHSFEVRIPVLGTNNFFITNESGPAAGLNVIPDTTTVDIHAVAQVEAYVTDASNLPVAGEWVRFTTDKGYFGTPGITTISNQTKSNGMALANLTTSTLDNELHTVTVTAIGTNFYSYITTDGGLATYMYFTPVLSTNTPGSFQNLSLFVTDISNRPVNGESIMLSCVYGILMDADETNVAITGVSDENGEINFDIRLTWQEGRFHPVIAEHANISSVTCLVFSLSSLIVVPSGTVTNSPASMRDIRATVTNISGVDIRFYIASNESGTPYGSSSGGGFLNMPWIWDMTIPTDINGNAVVQFYSEPADGLMQYVAVERGGTLEQVVKVTNIARPPYRINVWPQSNNVGRGNYSQHTVTVYNIIDDPVAGVRVRLTTDQGNFYSNTGPSVTDMTTVAYYGTVQFRLYTLTNIPPEYHHIDIMLVNYTNLRTNAMAVTFGGAAGMTIQNITGRTVHPGDPVTFMATVYDWTNGPVPFEPIWFSLVGTMGQGTPLYYTNTGADGTAMYTYICPNTELFRDNLRTRIRVEHTNANSDETWFTTKSTGSNLNFSFSSSITTFIKPGARTRILIDPLTDENGDPWDNQIINFYVNSSNGSLTVPYRQTETDGRFYPTLPYYFISAMKDDSVATIYAVYTNRDGALTFKTNMLYITNESGSPNNLSISPTYTTIRPTSNQRISIQVNNNTNGYSYPCAGEVFHLEVNFGTLNVSNVISDQYGRASFILTAANLDDTVHTIKIIHSNFNTNYAYITSNSELPDHYFIGPVRSTNSPASNQIFIVTLYDRNNHPVANEAVSFAAMYGSFNTNSVNTLVDGSCQVIYTSPDLDGIESVISADIASLSPVYATNYTLSSWISDLWIDPTNDSVVSGSNRIISVRLFDMNGHPKNNEAIRFTTDHGLLQGISQIITNLTGSDGAAQVILTTDNLDNQVHIVTATSISSNISNISKITTKRGSGALSLMNSFPTNTSVLPNSVVNVITYVVDINGHPCYGEDIVYESDRGLFTGNNNVKITNSTGVDGLAQGGFRTEISDGIIHTIKVYHLTNASLNTNFLFIRGEASVPVQLRIVSVKTNPTLPGSPVSIGVKVSDNFNNGVRNEDIFFQTDHGNVLPDNLTSDSNGMAWTILNTLDLDNVIHAFMASHSYLPSVMTNILTVAGTASNITVYSGNNQTGIVGQQLNIPLQVRVTDNSNNPVANASVIFKFQNNSYNGAFSITNGLTSQNGLSETFLTLGTKATTYIIMASNTTAGQATFTQTANNSFAHHYQVYPANPTNVNVDIGQIPVNIQLVDYYNNPISQSYSVQAIVNNNGLFQNGASITNGVTDGNGQFNQILYTSTNANTSYQVNVSSPGNINGQSADITTIPGSPVNFIIYPASSTNVSSGAQVSINARLVDQYNNQVLTNGITVNFSENTNGFLNPLTDISTNGMVSTVLTASTNVGATNRVTVWNAAISTNVSGDIRVISGPPNKITLTPIFSSTNISAATNYIEFIADIRDQYGNPVMNGTTVNWGQTGDPGYSYSKGAVTSTINGIVTNIFYTSTVASNTHRVTVSAGTASTQSGLMTVLPATPTYLRIYPLNNTNIRSSAGSLQISAQVCDRFYNPVNAGGYQIQWDIISNSGVTGSLDNGLTKYTNLSGADGRALANLTISTVAGDYHCVKIDCASLTNDITGRITIIPGYPEMITFNNIIANTQISADIHEFNYQLTIRDKYGNLVSNNTAITLRWIDPLPVNTGSGAQFVPGSFQAIRYTSVGQITALLNLSEKEKDDYILYAHTRGDSNITKRTCQYRVMVTNGTAHHYLVLVRTNQTVITNIDSDYFDQNIVQAQLVDEYDNTVEESGHRVTFTDISTNNGEFDDLDGGGWESSGTNTTTPWGIATNRYKTSVRAGNIHVVRASSDGGSIIGDSYNIIIGPGTTVKLIMEIPGTNDYYASADAIRVPLQVHTADSNNNFTTLSGLGITWNVKSNSGVPGYFANTGSEKYTNLTINGISVATLVISTNAYDYHIIEVDQTNFPWLPPDSPVSTGRIIVNPGQPAIFSFPEITGDTNIPADNNTINVKVKVYDQFWNMVTNNNQISWNFIDVGVPNSGIAGGLSTNLTTITNGLGETEVFFTASTIMSDDFRIIVTSVLSGFSNLSPRIIVDHGAPKILGFNVYTNGISTTNISVDTLSALAEVRLYDAYSNRVDTPGTDYSAYNIFFSINSNGQFFSATNWTDLNGIATNSFSVWTNPTAHTLRAWNSNISTNTFIVHSLPGACQKINFISPVNTTNISADLASITGKIELRDKYGNLVLPHEVHWSYISNINNGPSSNKGYNQDLVATNFTTNGYSSALFSTSTTLSDEFRMVAEANMTFATSALLIVDHGNVTNFRFSFDKTNITADSNWVTIYAQSIDQFGNNVNFSVPVPVNFSDITNGIFAQNPVNSDLAGLAITIMTTSKVSGTAHRVTAWYSNASGTSSNIFVIQGMEYVFTIDHATNAAIGLPFNLTVRIKDRWNNYTTDYTGTILLSHTGSTNIAMATNVT
ncbi:MAG: hypothetical protein JW827_04075, partial [Spirochaetes bacterium]|nr:hypothetical protein [Spirochaetota bacterium]